MIRIYVNNIHRGLHGTDTRSYDPSGNFNTRSFDLVKFYYPPHADDFLTFLYSENVLVPDL